MTIESYPLFFSERRKYVFNFDKLYKLQLLTKEEWNTQYSDITGKDGIESVAKIIKLLGAH